MIGFFSSAQAQSLDIAQDNLSVRIVKGSTILVEAEAISTTDMERLKAWLERAGADEVHRVESNLILGAVKLQVSAKVAKRWGAEPEVLAERFAVALKQGLGPALSWGRKDLVVPLGEGREIGMKLPEGLTVSVEVSDPGVLSLKDLGGGRYTVKGVSRGQGVIHARSSNGKSLPDLPFSVMPWAATWGTGPGRWELAGAIDKERLQVVLSRWLSARALAGSEISCRFQAEQSNGEWLFKVAAKAPGALSVEQTIKVITDSLAPMPFEPAEVVMLSNHPEKIFGEGVLFQREAIAKAYRVMWHHRNDPLGEERFLWLQVENPSPQPRTLRVICSSFGPSPDEIHVGHTAALNFASSALGGLTQRLTLPASSSRVIEVRRVKPGQTVSGVAYLQDEQGKSLPLKLTVSTSLAQSLPPTRAVASQDPGRTASGVFPAQLALAATHVLGGPFTYLSFGGEPYVTDLAGGYPSYGNFGTLYRTRLVLNNPAGTVKEARLGFASGGGAARAVVVVDGALYDLPMGGSGSGVPVTSFALAAGETRQVDIELFPQAGSNYPIRLVVHSDFDRLEKKEYPPIRPEHLYLP